MPWTLGTVLGGAAALKSLFGGGGGEVDPYSKFMAGEAKHWSRQARQPLMDVLGYYGQQFKNPFGPEFQSMWGQQQELARRQYEPMLANLQFNLAKRMGTADTSLMPGITGYVGRMWGQDLQDFLRNYAATAKSTYGQALMGGYQGLMGQTQAGLGQAAQSWQMGQARQAQNQQNLGMLLGLLSGMAGGGGAAGGATGNTLRSTAGGAIGSGGGWTHSVFQSPFLR